MASEDDFQRLETVDRMDAALTRIMDEGFQRAFSEVGLQTQAVASQFTDMQSLVHLLAKQIQRLEAEKPTLKEIVIQEEPDWVFGETGS